MRTTTFALALVLLAACSKSNTSTPPATTADPAAEQQPAEGQPPVDVETPERPQLSAAECEAQGGQVVGDIGDGAIHRPGYLCPDSGEEPLGSIMAEGGGPIPVEGSVCCR